MSKKVKVIYQYLLNRIQSNDMKLGMQLPTEYELSKKFLISRPTISKALTILEKEGYISRKQGIGIFIKKKSTRKNSFSKKSIGLLFPLVGKGEIFNPIAKEIIRLSEQYNFNLMWGGQFNPLNSYALQMNQMIDFYISNNINGLIMAPVELSKECLFINKKTIDKVKRHKIPTVLVDADYVEFPNRSEFDLVCVDNYRIGYEITKHFIYCGATRVDYCSYKYSAQTVAMRIKGYKQALIDAGIVPLHTWIHSGDPSDTQFVESLLKDNAQNFVCSNDSFAYELMNNFEKMGYKIPSDVRLAGVDDIIFSQHTSVPLTTIMQPCKEIARISIETLLSKIEDEMTPVRTIILNGQLKIRASSKL